MAWKSALPGSPVVMCHQSNVDRLRGRGRRAADGGGSTAAVAAAAADGAAADGALVRAAARTGGDHDQRVGGQDSEHAPAR